MAAIYSGIHLKLKSPQTPWEDKLKLARFAWISSQCLLPNKEQVLLDWSTHALTGWYSHKVEFSQNVLEGLWCYLDDVLRSRKLRSLLGQGKTISLRLNMAQLLLDRLRECACAGSGQSVCVTTLLSVCQGILSSPALSSIFTTKYELMVDLLAKFCSLACRELQQPSLTGALPAHMKSELEMTESVASEDEPMTEAPQNQPNSDSDPTRSEPVAESPPDQPETNESRPQEKESLRSGHTFEVLLQVLSCYLSVQRQQANPNRVFTMVSNHLIQPVVLLRHLLTSGERTLSHTHLRLRQQLCRDIRVKIDSVLQLALFSPEHLASYKEELLPSKEDSSKRGPGGMKGLLKPVGAVLDKLSDKGYCEPSMHYAVKSNAFTLLFKFFLENYGRGGEEEKRMLCFYFLTRLISALDVGLDGPPVSAVIPPEQSSPPAASCSPESWSLALLAVEALLSQALSADIYNVAADRIRHGEVQLKFYTALAQMLFNQAQPSIPAWYRCLKVLLGLNHLILEPDLDQVLSLAWVDTECMETRVQRARQLMVCSLLQTYTKLRQLPRFFSELLSIICRPALDDLRPPLLFEGVSASLRTCLLDTPPSHGLEICSSVLENIRRYILPDLVKEGSKEEKMEVERQEGGDDTGEKEGDKTDGERGDAALKLFSLSQLLHAVFFSLKTLDNASPLPLVRQTHSLMEEMWHVVKDLLQLVSVEKKATRVGIETDTGLIKKKSRKSIKNTDHRESKNASDSQSGVMWKQKTQEAALLLRYTWVEVDTLFHIHCSKYTSQESAQTASASVLSHIESLVSGEIFAASLQPSCSPVSFLLLKLLTLQQMKKVMLDTPLLSQPSTAALLSRAAHFILAREELDVSLDGEQVWDGQIGSVNASSYLVAHWYLVTSNLPLIAPYLTGEDVGCMADVLVSSLLGRQTGGGKDQLPGCLSVSHISSQLIQSPILVELPPLFSATVRSLTKRITGVLMATSAPQVGPMLLKLQEVGLPEKGAAVNQLEGDADQTPPAVKKSEAIVEQILRSSKTGEVSVVLSDTQTKELLDLFQIATNLNPDGMNSEDLSCLFLLLCFILSSTSSQPDRATKGPSNPGGDAVFLGRLLRLLTSLLEGRNFQSVLKLIHGSSLLQAAVSSLLVHSNSGRFHSTSSPDRLDLIKAVQVFIRSLVQFIIIRNSSVRLNLEQFTSYLTSNEVAKKQMAVTPASKPAEAPILGKPEAEVSIFSIHLLLASLTSFSQAMTSNLGRSKQMDQTLTQMIARTTAALGPAIEAILQPQPVSQNANQPAGVLGQAFLVKVVTIMLHCEMSSLSVESENKPSGAQPALTHMTLYRGFCQQILKEISSAPRPMDFLVSSLRFLSAFYQAVGGTGREKEEEEEGEEEKKRRKEADELYSQILQCVYRLLAAPWLSQKDGCEVEPAVEELLRHLVERSTTGQLHLVLLVIREGLDTGKLRAGNYREVLSAVIIVKLLSCCHLPEPCSKALWLIAPQLLSAMVFLVRSSSQDVSLTLPFTVPTVTSMTSLLRQGAGRISSPHHVTQVLGALQLVPLDRLTPPVYHAAFLAVHEALFAIIQCHPQVMLDAAPSFLNVFYRLVASIMQEGRQKGDCDSGADSDVYLQCSRLAERMYSHIAATAESFTTLSAFMVAQYVTELQKVTLRPDIKQHLTEGIYRILDLCMEQDIKFLTAGLQMGVREVFSELYSSYTHYHKTQRQGEDKYTA
ncbi:unhealthy ribosome biogenesis protein 2 homolog isoform X2 [Myripristis murdjan]|uniref:URB2 ribosome biogenesis homolog n=1 Tax=Myripristis murdjan TaxID=586833 RepID=A0A668A5G5_9TELE|nr:unhealthy ribosome biogenesis protein 2 homolog isoform X2 [Myripristis murdjan]